MTNYFQDIPSEIIDTLKTDSTLNDAINLWMVGAHPKIPLEYYPVCMVIPGDLDLHPTQQTGFYRYTMIGQLFFEVRIQDTIAPDSNNKLIINSYTSLVGHMYRVRQVFKAEANVRLDAPTIGADGYQIHRVEIAEVGEIGAEVREDNFFNRGMLLWSVDFSEART